MPPLWRNSRPNEEAVHLQHWVTARHAQSSSLRILSIIFTSELPNSLGLSIQPQIVQVYLVGNTTYEFNNEWNTN